MAEMKYSKYFLHELPDEQRFKGFAKMPTMVAFTDTDIIEGSKYFSVMVMGKEATKHAGHGPTFIKTPSCSWHWGRTRTIRETSGRRWKCAWGRKWKAILSPSLR